MQKISEEYEYVPVARVVRREHRRNRNGGSCGCFAIGEAPMRVVEDGFYGLGLNAHVANAKLDPADHREVAKQVKLLA